MAITETLNWGRRSLEAIKRRLHHERLLPVYHQHEVGDAESGGEKCLILFFSFINC